MIIDKALIIEKVNKKIVSNVSNLNQYMERIIAFDIIAGDRILYEVDHSWDPSWDCSGHLEKSGTFEISDDILFKDYLGFYTGNSRPSFCSGCGIFHENNEEWLQEELMNCLLAIQDDVIREEVQRTDIHSLYEWFSDNDDYSWRPFPGFHEFGTNFEKYIQEIVDIIREDIDDETLTLEYLALFEELPIQEENPSLKTIAKRHKKEISKIINNENFVEKHMNRFVIALKEKLPETESFFGGKKLTKENKAFLKSFYQTFTEEEIALITYFEPYHFSNSLLDPASVIRNAIGEERNRMETLYICEVAFTIE